jgi:hypothetical protein
VRQVDIAESNRRVHGWAFAWRTLIAADHRTAHRVHNAAELGQHPVAGVLDNPPTVLGDLGIDKKAQVVLELRVRALFVHAGQPAVTSHIRRQDGCEPSLYPLGGQGCSPAPWCA